MHQGKTYLVKDLDLSRKIAICEAADLKYYTKTRDYTDIHVLGGKIVRRVKHPSLFVHLSRKIDCNMAMYKHGEEISDYYRS